MRPTILVTDHPSGDLSPEREILAPLGAELRLASAADEATLVREAHGVAGILVCFAPVTEAVVAAAGGARVIARYGIGVDNIAVDAATAAGITVTNVPDYCLDEVADHTLALLLAHARGVAAAARETAAGGWSLPAAPAIHRLAGRRLALVGLGAIGRRVASRARAFGLEVVAFDPFARGDLDGVTLTDTLAEALDGAAFVSLHVPLTPSTRHLIDAEAIALMSGRPLLVNTARGGLVDLDAATQALADGRLSGLALDVTDPEPPPADHPLRTAGGAILTPHMAFHSEEATLELQRRAAQEVARALRGEPPDRRVG